MSEQISYIYGLGHPRTGELFYVGCTSKPIKRYKEHCTLRGRLRKGEFFGVKSVFVVLRTATDAIAAANLEEQLIRVMKEAGHPLVNVAVSSTVKGSGRHLNSPKAKKHTEARFTLNDLIRS